MQRHFINTFRNIKNYILKFTRVSTQEAEMDAFIENLTKPYGYEETIIWFMMTGQIPANYAKLHKDVDQMPITYNNYKERRFHALIWKTSLNRRNHKKKARRVKYTFKHFKPHRVLKSKKIFFFNRTQFAYGVRDLIRNKAKIVTKESSNRFALQHHKMKVNSLLTIGKARILLFKRIKKVLRKKKRSSSRKERKARRLRKIRSNLRVKLEEESQNNTTERKTNVKFLRNKVYKFYKRLTYKMIGRRFVRTTKYSLRKRYFRQLPLFKLKNFKTTNSCFRGTILNFRTSVKNSTHVNNNCRIKQQIRSTHTSNAFMECYILLHRGQPLPENLERETVDIINYIASCLDSKLTLTETIQNAIPNLGYKIHPETFFFALSDLVNMAKISERSVAVFDDLSMLNHTRKFDGKTETLGISFKNDQDIIYAQYNRIADMPPINTPIIFDLNPNPDIPDIVKQKYQAIVNTSVNATLTPKRPSAAETEYTRLAVPKSSDSASDTDSTTSSFHDSVNNNNLEILLYAVSAFIIINGIAWCVRKYYPETLGESQETPKEIFYSVNEPVIYSKFSTAVFMLLVPSFLVILYHFRYYYYYRLKQLLVGKRMERNIRRSLHRIRPTKATLRTSSTQVLLSSYKTTTNLTNNPGISNATRFVMRSVAKNSTKVLSNVAQEGKKAYSKYVVTEHEALQDPTKTGHPTVAKIECENPECNNTNCATDVSKCSIETQQAFVVGHQTHNAPENCKVVALEGSVGPRGPTNTVIYEKKEPVNEKDIYDTYRHRETTIVQQDNNTQELNNKTKALPTMKNENKDENENK